MGNDVGGMVENVVAAIPALLLLLNVVISLSALCFIFFGVYKFTGVAKRDGMTRPLTPWMFLLAGAMLWNFGAATTAFLDTLYGAGTSNHNLLAYSPNASMPKETSRMIEMLVMCVRLFGYVTFARGWYRVTAIGAGKATSEGAFGSAFWMIFGGTLAINIVATVNGVTSFLGFGRVL